jgi:Arm DNA-binding domain
MRSHVGRFQVTARTATVPPAPPTDLIDTIFLRAWSRLAASAFVRVRPSVAEREPRLIDVQGQQTFHPRGERNPGRLPSRGPTARDFTCWVTQGGSKLWQLAYRFAGKQKTIALGQYPAVTLAMAREAKLEARRLLAQGIDPSEKRKAEKRAAAAARTFGEVANKWFDTKRVPEGKSEATLKRDRWLMRELKSEIGDRPIGEIEAPELLAPLKKVQARKHYEIVSRVSTLASQVFCFGIWNGYCKRDAAADLKGAFTSRKSKRRSGLTDAAAVGKFGRAIDGYAGKCPRKVGFASALPHAAPPR